MNQWINFYKTRYIPAVEKAFSGMKMCILWGDRGDNKNQVAILTIFESVAVRDKYYPVENSETMSDATKAADEKLKAINDEADKLILPGAKRFYTDWIVK
jgi:hypothetical protein